MAQEKGEMGTGSGGGTEVEEGTELLSPVGAQRLHQEAQMPDTELWGSMISLLDFGLALV